MNKSLPFFVLLLVFARFVHAAPLDRDLGHGLAYHRIHQLPADLPAAGPAHPTACVLDLRYVQAEAADAAGFVAWLKSRATARTPVFVLANSGTGHALLAPLAGREPAAGVVVIGAASPGFNPDIALKITPEAERRAYDALENGAPVDSLLVENTDKPRNDEARLAKEHLPDSAVADEPIPDRAPPAADPAAKPKPPAPPIDAALQRAVQLHRTLVALKKIPPAP